jgi:hypothetical protein
MNNEIGSGKDVSLSEPISEQLPRAIMMGVAAAG